MQSHGRILLKSELEIYLHVHHKEILETGSPYPQTVCSVFQKADLIIVLAVTFDKSRLETHGSLLPAFLSTFIPFYDVECVIHAVTIQNFDFQSVRRPISTGPYFYHLLLQPPYLISISFSLSLSHTHTFPISSCLKSSLHNLVYAIPLS